MEEIGSLEEKGKLLVHLHALTPPLYDRGWRQHIKPLPILDKEDLFTRPGVVGVGRICDGGAVDATATAASSPSRGAVGKAESKGQGTAGIPFSPLGPEYGTRADLGRTDSCLSPGSPGSGSAVSQRHVFGASAAAAVRVSAEGDVRGRERIAICRWREEEG